MKIVWECDNFFLRDDFDIREHYPPNLRQAYSLFRQEPYGRIQVFCGSLEFAIDGATEVIETGKNVCGELI